MNIMKKKTDDKQWEVVVNPNAGKQKGEKDWGTISGLLRENGIPFHASFTTGPGHAIELTRDAIAGGARNFIVVGGDGTMNEVVNGIFGKHNVPTQDFVLGMISVGTGNDWGRMFAIPPEYDKAVQTIKREETFLQDAGLVRYLQDTEKKERYFINIAGLGFDAVVVRKSNRQKQNKRSGLIIYMRNLLTTLASYRHTQTRIRIDDAYLIDDVFTISIGIGKFTGGGMMQTPYARADDGYFDLTVVRRMKKMEIVRSLKRLYDGTILEHPKVSGFRGKKIQIDSDPPIHLEVDGESLGHSPIEMKILPRRIQVITGKDFIPNPVEVKEPAGFQTS
jgi:YegS/Rv2252/BmrU family lipid kinase